MSKIVTSQRRGYKACGWSAHRALQCAFIVYDLDDRVLAGVEVEVAVLRVAVQAAVAVAARWRSRYADVTDAPCTGTIKSLGYRYSLSRNMRARETSCLARACTARCTFKTCTKLMSPIRFTGGGR